MNIFPVRKRCKKCGKGLGRTPSDPVYAGLYCSPACGGFANPPTDPTKAPRECITQRDGRWVFKRRYRSKSEIPEKIRKDPSTDSYLCNGCQHLHIGHSRLLEIESFRKFNNIESLQDFLKKIRGGASIKDVAAKAGVRPIRLKELEEGTPHSEGLETLFKVLKVHGAGLGGVIRGSGDFLG